MDKIKYLVLMIYLLTGCSYLNYGLTSIPEGCQVNSYRKADGNLKYYVTGENCAETERLLNDRNKSMK